MRLGLLVTACRLGLPCPGAGTASYAWPARAASAFAFAGARSILTIRRDHRPPRRPPRAARDLFSRRAELTSRAISSHRPYARVGSSAVTISLLLSSNRSLCPLVCPSARVRTIHTAPTSPPHFGRGEKTRRTAGGRSWSAVGPRISPFGGGAKARRPDNLP